MLTSGEKTGSDEILKCNSPWSAKKLSKSLPAREDWEDVKLNVMADILSSKFSDTFLKVSLIETYPSKLEEGNSWGDRFWGVCDHSRVGSNHLGILLMELRFRLMKENPEMLSGVFRGRQGLVDGGFLYYDDKCEQAEGILKPTPVRGTAKSG